MKGALIPTLAKLEVMVELHSQQDSFSTEFLLLRTYVDLKNMYLFIYFKIPRQDNQHSNNNQLLYNAE